MLKWKCGILAGLGAALILAGFGLGSGSRDVRADELPKDEEVKIDKQNFPDAVFRKFVSENYDLNQNGSLSVAERKAVFEIEIVGQNIKTLQGIEFFTDLEGLSCFPVEYGSDPEFRGALQELDVSKNSKLRELNVNGNRLTKLDLSQNPKLIGLKCGCNFISVFKLNKDVSIEYIDCSYNNIGGELDFSNMPNLKVLSCGFNSFTSIDVSKCNYLTELNCSSNQISELKLGDQKELVILECGNNIISGSLDISSFMKLEKLECSFNQLSEIIIGDKPELIILRCSGNLLSGLELGKLPKLKCLEISYNNISAFDISPLQELLIFECRYTKITSLDLSKNPKLAHLWCDGNAISKLDISRQPGIVDMVQTVEPELWENGKSHFYFKKFEPSQVVDVGVIGYSLLISVDTEIVYKDVTPIPKKKSIGDFVERLYTVALDREAEEDGKKYWVDEITSGRKTGGDCGLFFLTGAEFMNRKISVEDFVETLYKTFFDRASEAEGKAYWVGVLKNGGDRNAVVKGFIDSKEWCNICADYGVRSGAPTAKAERASKNASDFATRLYICCLGRDPEEAGLKYWALALTNLEQTGATAAKEFFGSEEFKNLKLGDEEFLTRLYTTFMDREPEPEGLEFWLDQLQGGATREQVLAQFVVSDEFTEICAKYGIERGSI